MMERTVVLYVPAGPVSGVFDPVRRCIDLIGPESERALADWMGIEVFDRTGLNPSEGGR
jgi:hypothetical protein